MWFKAMVLTTVELPFPGAYVDPLLTAQRAFSQLWHLNEAGEFGNYKTLPSYLRQSGATENRFWKSCDILKLSQPFLKSRVMAVLLFRVIDCCVLCIALQGQICLPRTGLPEFRVT